MGQNKQLLFELVPVKSDLVSLGPKINQQLNYLMICPQKVFQTSKFIHES